MTIRPARAGSGAPRGERGFTLVELVCATAILVVLAALALPVANTLLKRQKEVELRRALREIREALDRFQFDTTRYAGIRTKHLNAANEEGYPEELKLLVEGVDTGELGLPQLKYLRRIPLDPMTGNAEWATRSTRDRPDSLFTDGINIFDVRSKSDRVGLNDVPYKKW